MILVLLGFARAIAGEVPGPELEAPAPPAPEEVVVAVSPFPPFVQTDGDVPTGFSVDLWEAVAREAGLPYRYLVVDDVAHKLAAVHDGRADVAIGGISITFDRERTLDFTLPVFRTGLGILVRDEHGWSLVRAARAALTPARLGIVLGFFGLIVVSGHLVWWAERGHDGFHDRYLPGVLEGMYWAIVTASTVGYGDKAPVGWPGRALAGLVIVVSLPLFAVFTAELASTLTLATLDSDISGPQDLRGHRVGVRPGTTGEQAVRSLGATPVPLDTPEDGYRALLADRVDAYVHDAPVLDWLVRREPEGGVHVADTIFDPQRYGFVVAQDSPLRERLSLALLAVRERGEWTVVRDRWFSGDTGE